MCHGCNRLRGGISKSIQLLEDLSSGEDVSEAEAEF